MTPPTRVAAAHLTSDYSISTLAQISPAAGGDVSARRRLSLERGEPIGDQVVDFVWAFLVEPVP